MYIIIPIHSDSQAHEGHGEKKTAQPVSDSNTKRIKYNLHGLHYRSMQYNR